MLVKKLSSKLAVTVVASTLVFSAWGKSNGVTEITFWHSMSGVNGTELNAIVDGFNKKHPEYKVNPIHKGSYEEAMNAGIAAYRAKQSPDIIQVFEVGTATMMHSGNVIKPIQQMSEEVGNPIDTNDFIGAVAAYYSGDDGKLVSMPFNSSTPVLYYNKDVFKKAGLDPNRAPKTYAELKQFTKQIKQSGAAQCGYTTDWPDWILIENAAAWHNAPYASENNGFGGLKARISLQDPLYKRLITDLSEMSKDGTFTYGGRGSKASALFIGGQCAIFTGSSGGRANIKAGSKFDFGISTLPYYEDIKGAPQNSIIGGASLWVFNGKSKEKYQGITEFFKYLSSPEVAASWHQKTGYVPVVKSAYELTKKQGFYAANPGAEVPVNQLNVTIKDHSRGIRLGNLPSIRNIEVTELEKVFAGNSTPEKAIQAIEKQANAKLAEFEKNHK